jgi:hypothetical protein
VTGKTAVKAARAKGHTLGSVRLAIMHHVGSRAYLAELAAPGARRYRLNGAESESVAAVETAKAARRLALVDAAIAAGAARRLAGKAKVGENRLLARGPRASRPERRLRASQRLETMRQIPAAKKTSSVERLSSG